MAALMSSTVTSPFTTACRIVVEPVGVGTRWAAPMSLPFSSGITRPLRTVENHLVASVSVYGGHDTALDSSEVVQSLGHGSQTVSGARSSRDNGVSRSQGLVVYVVNDGGQVVAGRSRDHNLLGTSLDVSRSLLLRSVETGALQNNVNIELAPRQLGSVGNSVDGNLLTINDDRVVGAVNSVLVLTDLAAETTLSGVILQQVSLIATTS